MKQWITVDQLNELSEEQKVKLREWWEFDSADMVCSTKTGRCFIGCEVEGLPVDNYLLPQLSIGQMIALLHSKTKEQALGWNDTGCFWHVHIGPRGTGSMLEGVGKTFTDNEIENGCLADTLWEAVKAVL